MTKQFERDVVLTRRQCLLGLGACVAGGLQSRLALASDPDAQTLSFGLVTDVHHADMPTMLNRNYRDSLEKLGKAVETFRQRKVAFMVQLGDIVDLAPTNEENLRYLKEVRAVLDRFSGPKYHALGNHCLWRLSRDEFMAGIGWPGRKGHYSFNHGAWHFVVLDANYRPDETAFSAGNFDWRTSWIPADQQQWLRDDLRSASSRPTIILLHHNLHSLTASRGVANAETVRAILEASGNVVAVFQGHLHKGGYTQIHGIHYVTFRGMIEEPASEGSTYAVVTLGPGRQIQIEGFGRQPSKQLPAGDASTSKAATSE